MYRSCRTCRLRRRACDKQKPFCGTCAQLGRQCDGYEDESEALFVNYDSHTVKGRKKRVLCDAIADRRRGAKSQGQVSSSLYSKDQVVARSQRNPYHPTLTYFANNPTLDYDLTPDFSLHLQTLWKFFLTHNAIANEAWDLGFTPFVLTSQTFDLAILAMSAYRFGLSEDDSRMTVLSTAAYHKSLELFRKQVVMPDCPRKQACLSVIAFALCLADAARMTPADILSDIAIGSHLHLQGAIIFMRQCGPKAFQTDGFHWIFKKVREISAIMSMSYYEPSCFVDKSWMTVPWTAHEKTLRDRLHDIFIQLTVIVAKTLNPMINPMISHKEQMPCIRAELKRLRGQLNAWRHGWESDERPRMSLYERTLFDAELLSLKLVCALVDLRTADDADSALELCRMLARSLRVLLRQPMFGSYDKVIRDAIEGQCRAIFPFWVLSQYCLHDSEDLQTAVSGNKEVNSIGFVDYLNAVPAIAKQETPRSF